MFWSGGSFATVFVLSLGQRWVSYGQGGTQLWKSALSADWVPAIGTGDVDGDMGGQPGEVGAFKRRAATPLPLANH